MVKSSGTLTVGVYQQIILTPVQTDVSCLYACTRSERPTSFGGMGLCGSVHSIGFSADYYTKYYVWFNGVLVVDLIAVFSLYIYIYIYIEFFYGVH